MLAIMETSRCIELETEENIWKIAENLCGRLKENGSEAVVMAVNPKNRTTDFVGSNNGNLFLERNPDCLQRFKDFCVKLYSSEDPAIKDDCKETSQATLQPHDQTDKNNQSGRLLLNQTDTTSQSGPKLLNQTDTTNQSDEDTEDYSDYETTYNAGDRLILDTEKIDNRENKTDSQTEYGAEDGTKLTKPSQRITRNKNKNNQSILNKDRIKQKRTIVSKKRLNQLDVKKTKQTKTKNRNRTAETDIQSHDVQEKEITSPESERNCEQRLVDKITCPICQTVWPGQISYVNHLRIHKDVQLCKMCDELVTLTDTTMEQHIEKNHSEKLPYKCKICGRGYKTKNGVKNHSVSVHADSSARYWCENCDRAFGTKNNYMAHMRSHKGGKKCFICVQKFDTMELLSTHMRDCHANYLCLICSSYFPDLSELQEHEQSHTEQEKKFGINVDIKQYYGSTKEVQNSKIQNTNTQNDDSNKRLGDSDVSLIKGDNSDVKSANKSDKGEGTARKSFKCKFCGRVFKVAMHFSRHIRLHNNKSNFSCQHCGKVCKSEETYKHHIALHLPDNKKPYQCADCGKGFVTRTALKKHSIVHTKAKDYICEFCGKRCRDTTKLQIHRRSHTGERPYKCKLCTKSYRSWDALRNHQLVHQPKQSFMCDICGKLYSQKHRLHDHKRTHREDGLKCDVCGLQTLSVGAVRRHLVLEHLEIAKERGFKVYTCEYCQKIIPNKEKYDYHIRIHTGARPFACNECGKSFRDRKQLKMHKRIHTNDKKYECTVCHKLFQYNRTLKKHMVSHDKDMLPDRNMKSHDTKMAAKNVPHATYNNTNISQCHNETPNYNTITQSHVYDVMNNSTSAVLQPVHHMTSSHGYPINYYADRSIAVNDSYCGQLINPEPHSFITPYPNHNIADKRIGN